MNEPFNINKMVNIPQNVEPNENYIRKFTFVVQ